jgi:hypothetical protein
MSVIAFLVHSIIFIVMIVFAIGEPTLLSNQDYVNILYIILGTLILHGGFMAGKTSRSS